MRKIVYYVASSLDGFIAGPNDDVSNFIYVGSGVDQYLKDLKNFDTVIMGRNTYEFGFKYGAVPGEPSPAYPHMKHYIFSNQLAFEKQSPLVEVKNLAIAKIDKLKSEPGTDIYLCGGGRFAGWLLANKKIDILKIKLNPVILGDGVRLFEASTPAYRLELKSTEDFEHGLQILTYDILYAGPRD